MTDCINVITLLCEKTLKTSVVDRKKTDEKETLDLKKVYNHYNVERKEIMGNTSFKIEEVFGNVISKDNFSQEQITKINSFSAKKGEYNYKYQTIFFKPRMKNNNNY